jgi:hypothetical protein
MCYAARIEREELGGERKREETDFEICPSRKSTVLICERRSGSWIAGVYVEAALGTLTGVVGSEAIMLVFVRSDVFKLVDGNVKLRVVCSRFAVGNDDETMRTLLKKYARVLYGNSWKNGLRLVAW